MRTFFLSFCGFLAAILLQLPAVGQTHFISLDKKQLAIGSPTVYVGRVVDGRPSKANIGSVQTGMMNKKVPAAFEKSLESALGNFFTHSLPHHAGAKPVVVKVLQLQVSEHTGVSTETAKAIVSVEFLYEQDNLFYSLLKTSAVTESRGLEVTNHHADNVARALSKCFEPLALVKIDEKVALGPALRWEDVQKSQEQEAVATAILQEEAPVRGIYNNVSEFMANAPGITSTFEIDVKPLAGKKGAGEFSYTPYLLLPDGKKKPLKNVWGFSDGIAVLIHHRNAYCPLIRKGNEFSFFGTKGPDQQAVAIGAAAGGLLGAAIASAATGGDVAEYVLMLPSGQIAERGQESQVVTAAVPEVLPPAKVVFYRVATAKQEPELNLFVGDDLVQAIGPNAVYEMEWAEATPLALCVKGQQEACLTFIPKLGTVQYVAFSTDKGRAALKQVEPKVGEHYAKRAKYLAEKGEKAGEIKQ